MVLHKFLRKRKRELQLHHQHTKVPRLNKKRGFNPLAVLSMTTPRQPLTQKVVVDKYVVDAMKKETEALLRNQNPSTVRALALALSQPERSVMVLYHDEQDDDSMSSMLKRWKRFSLLPVKEGATPCCLKRALTELETAVDSGTKTISNWDEAKAVLATLIQFPDEKPAEDQSTSQKASEVEEYKKRIKLATQVKDFDMKSKYAWNRLREASIPSKFGTSDEPCLVDDQALLDAAAKNDALLSEKIARAQEESDRLAKGEAAKEMKERAAQAAREQEATRLAASLLRPLTKEEQQIVHAAMYGAGPPNEVLAQVESDSVQRKSMQCLQPGEWLNDEAIHYFYVMLTKRDEELCKLDPNRKRSHFFKSFFMTKLLNEGNADPELDGKYDYKNVKRWSKKVPGKDIFKLDKIFFPINQGRMHWMCAMIDMTKKKIYMYDSMGSNGMHYLKSLFQYIQDEHMAKKGVPLPDVDKWELIGHQPGTPCQRNGYDCGVFTCMFADFLSREWPLVFTQEHITQCRERIALSIMQGSAIM
jgi:sentrin-specific protease 1